MTQILLAASDELAERALLVGAIVKGGRKVDSSDSLDELAQLAQTAGALVVGRITQVLPKPNPATYIGSGKVAAIGSIVAERKIRTVIFDDDLSPNQIRNLERALECKLVDRSQLILDIFARRARTAVAKTQVELAQLDYLRTRLTRHWTHLSRQQGGIGTRGPGETQIETDRRLISRRMATLRDRLVKIDRQRTTQRRGREQHFRVALVGYTNAGKSTLMNVLAGSDVLAEDRLFATLDATTRQITLSPSTQVLLSDTVGFIRKLPHNLIESFKSTLDEVRQSDVLLHVTSVAYARFEDHMLVVRQTLREIGAEEVPSLLVFNKIDALEDGQRTIAAMRRHYPDAVFVSALRGMGLRTLRQRLEAVVQQDYVESVACVPVTDGKTLACIRQLANVLDEQLVEVREAGQPPREALQVRFRAGPAQQSELRLALAPYSGLHPVAQPVK